MPRIRLPRVHAASLVAAAPPRGLEDLSGSAGVGAPRAAPSLVDATATCSTRRDLFGLGGGRTSRIAAFTDSLLAASRRSRFPLLGFCAHVAPVLLPPGTNGTSSYVVQRPARKPRRGYDRMRMTVDVQRSVGPHCVRVGCEEAIAMPARISPRPPCPGRRRMIWGGVCLERVGAAAPSVWGECWTPGQPATRWVGT